MKARRTSCEGIGSPLITSLQGSLNQLEVEKANLMIGGFSQTSERVRDLDRQIDSTRAQLRHDAAGR